MPSGSATGAPSTPTPTGAQSQPNGAAQPPAGQPTAGQPTAGQPPAGQPTAGQTSPGGAKLPSIGSDPAKALADAGPKGQAYLKALRDAGVPIQPGVEGVYILFAQVTCEAKTNGTPRQDILTQFDQIGPVLAPGSKMTPGQVSEAFVSAAEKNFC